MLNKLWKSVPGQVKANEPIWHSCLTPHAGYVQYRKTDPVLFHTFDVRVQLYARNSFLMTSNLEDTPTLYTLVLKVHSKVRDKFWHMKAL